MSASVKFAPGSDNLLYIRAIPFGGLIRGRDTDGEYFSPRTNLCLDLFPDQRPLLYDHGLNAKTGLSVIGRVDSTTLEQKEDGHWVQAQLNRNSQYLKEIQKLIAAEALYSSSGALTGYTQKSKSGEILRWPWIEQSLTPTPANMLATVSRMDATKHYKAVDLDFELPLNWETGDVAGTRKVGRVISAATEAKIQHALDDLTAVLAQLAKS